MTSLRRLRPTAIAPRGALGLLLPLVLIAACAPSGRDLAERDAGPTAERGRYLVSIGGCNDCHTPGFLESGGTLVDSEWLTGSPVGFLGPWGTTYPPNRRLTAQNLTEEQWVTLLGTRTGLPPMPWPSVNAMTEDDRRSIYRFLRELGPKGDPVQVALAPGIQPVGPWMDFNVYELPTVTASAGADR